VQRDRIAAAACFLPLSMNPVLSTQLGTRHRAGIGVTEETDAIAVIVSEETGAISLAVSGKIERDLSVERLRERLGALVRRYVAPSTLPTPISAIDEAAREESTRAVSPRGSDSRLDSGIDG
jgi:diadenylate cyclase